MADKPQQPVLPPDWDKIIFEAAPKEESCSKESVRNFIYENYRDVFFELKPLFEEQPPEWILQEKPEVSDSILHPFDQEKQLAFRKKLSDMRDYRPLIVRNVHASFNIAEEYINHDRSGKHIDHTLYWIGFALSVVNWVYPLLIVVSIFYEAYQKHQESLKLKAALKETPGMNEEEIQKLSPHLTAFERELTPTQVLKLSLKNNRGELIHNTAWFVVRLLTCFVLVPFTLPLTLGLFTFGFIKSAWSGFSHFAKYDRWIKKVDQKIKDEPLMMADDPTEAKNQYDQIRQLKYLRKSLFQQRQEIGKQKIIDLAVWTSYLIGFGLCFIVLPLGASIVIATCLTHFYIKHHADMARLSSRFANACCSLFHRRSLTLAAPVETKSEPRASASENPAGFFSGTKGAASVSERLEPQPPTITSPAQPH